MGCWMGDGEETACLDISDISITGAFVATQHPLPEGKTIRLELYTSHSARPVGIKAEVVWSRTEDDGDEEAGMGIRFLELDEEKRRLLLELAELERARSQSP